ncbi:MAG: hypothetical protein EOO61_03590 [Hymenobacter sp.]|nr:MAG: hypothetical protein EOO61_03590 [Hymenobacter sp.]
MPSVEINAMPTKGLFIDMLVKDVDLTDAISDLVDNCIDGAKRLRPAGDYTGLRIKIAFSKDSFSIYDNCGGIPLDIAKNQAFRFGRPSGSQATTGSVGQFGIGMKRALFKLGRWFKVSTTAEHEKYSITVPVEEWSKSDLPDSWHFQIDDGLDILQGNESFPTSDRYTSIEVRELREEAIRQFEDPAYSTRFRDKLTDAQNEFLKKGLEIQVNADFLVGEKFQLLFSEDLKSSFVREQYSEPNEKPVNVKYYVGMMNSIPADEAGWYVFCNGRMILRADRSPLVGWGEVAYNIPRYHNQYARFRGYAFFECEDSSRLPWNTTKTSLDRDSPVYLKAKYKMIELMAPIISFINELDREKDVDDKTYETITNEAKPVDIDSISVIQTFTYTPRAATTKAEKLIRITYSRRADEVNMVKEALGVRTNAEIGSSTFEYYLKYELGE